MGDRSRPRPGGSNAREPGHRTETAGARPRSEPTLILDLDAEISLEVGGGKGANLARLARAGFAVPPGFVLATHAYRDYVRTNGLHDWILDTAGRARADDPASLEAASEKIRAGFVSANAAATMNEAVRVAYTALGRPPVAVRSSATTEDLPDLSFAGQQDTMLNVVGDAALLAAVVQCWSSLWTARAIGYRARNGIAHEGAAIAVIVQRMVESETSGVMFTANPLTGKRSEIVIDSTFGLGEALVSGRVEPDHYVVDESSGSVLSRRVGAKGLSVRGLAAGGTRETEETAAERATLPDATAVELANLGRRIANLFGSPQDIEWARTDERFHVLQARPITSLFPLPDQLPSEGLRVLLSFGAFQGMLDPFTPLGRDVFRVALPRALAAVSTRLARGFAGTFVVAGERLFLDLTAQLRDPWIRKRLRSALAMVEPTTGEALDEVFAEPPPELTAARAKRWFPSARFVALVAHAMGNATYFWLRPERGRERIQLRLRELIEAFDRRSAAAQTLADRIALVEQAFSWLPHTGLPVLAAGFGTGLASLHFLHLLALDLPDGKRRVLEMTRGLPHNVTTEMDLALWDIARAIRDDAGTAALISSGNAAELAREFVTGRLPQALQGELASFLRMYGARVVGEIDLGRQRWRDDPTALLQVLQSYLRIADEEQAPDAVFRRGAEAAGRALATLVADIRRTRFGRLKAFVVKVVARRMRALAGLRESPKFTIITMLGAVRTGLLASGNDLAARGILDSPEDIFFLHLDELETFDRLEARDWRTVVAKRRRTYAKELRRRRVPRLMLSDGRVFLGGVSRGRPGEVETLEGAAVSPGVSEGVVRVVFEPSGAQLTPGEILVCRGTDPAWTPLFLAAAGLVTEVGGLMTHGSVVAREYGIPAVVGVHDATVRLRNGDRVRVDGTNGRVILLDPRETS